MPMKKAIMYGAGNIGRGFIGQLLSQSGYEVVFLDINETILTRLNADGCYPLRFVNSGGYSEISVTHVRGVNTRKQEEAVAEIAGADLMATAVGAGILKFIAPVIAQGLTQRWQAGDTRPLNILICENLMDANSVLRKLLLENLNPAYHAVFDQRVGLVETSVGRMVPVATAAMQEGNPARVWTEPYDELPADKAGFRGGIPDIVGLKPFAPFQFYIERKLYMHNMSHAVLAYLGSLSGCETIWEAVQKREIVVVVQAALAESARALSQKYNFPYENLVSFGRDLMTRFDNRLLGDTVARVGRDPIRKLAKNDRLMGAAQLCINQGIQPGNICIGIAAVLCFHSADDPATQELQAFISESGPAAALARYAGINKGNPLLPMILSDWKTECSDI